MEKQDELNARIAAEIMRWRLPEDPDQPRAWLEWSEADLRYVWSGWWAQEPEMDEDDRGESIVRMDYAVVGHSVWRPMTDIVASEEVVKAMFARGYWCEERTPWTPTKSAGFMITVANIRHARAGIYIGRVNVRYGLAASPLANPFRLAPGKEVAEGLL